MPPLQDFINNISDSDGFQLLSSNIDNSNEPELTGYKPYVIKDVGGRHIGIIGYTTQETPVLTALGKRNSTGVSLYICCFRLAYIHTIYDNTIYIYIYINCHIYVYILFYHIEHSV